MIELNDVGKRFNYDWVFKKINYTFTINKHYAIIGKNGSGKSTLLSIIAGYTNPTKGICTWHKNKEEIYKEVSICAPYIDIFEELTAVEFLQLHFKLKKILPQITIDIILEEIQLHHQTNKPIKYYSSGMKQRIKLAQAFFTNSSILLLDEPCTNLDEAGYNLYYNLINKYTENKLLIITSNDNREIKTCTEVLKMGDFL